MVQTFNQAQKSKELQQYFQQQKRIYIVVDARRDDVILPPHLKDDPSLRLVLNSRMPQPIHFFHNRIESTFSFSRVSFASTISISAIWAAYHPDLNLDEGLMWENDIPHDLMSIMLKKTITENGSPQTVGITSDTLKTPSQITPKKTNSTKRNHLRIVK